MTVGEEMGGPWTNTSGMGNGTMSIAAETPLWITILDAVQLSGSIVGIFANLVTIITLTINGEDFSDIIRMLFKYQSFLDCLVCLTAALLFSFRPMWTVGNTIFDTIVCQLWHGQYIFWLLVVTSVHNLVTLAAERYLCVVHPLKYQAMTKKGFMHVMIAIFISNAFLGFPSAIQTRYRDGACHSELLINTPAMARFYFFFSFWTFLASYAVPCLLFFVLYGLVIFTFRKRAKADLGASTTATVISKATTELTKTAIIVTVIFVFALGFDVIYYFFAHIGLVPYVFNSPIQKVAVFFSVINSVVNPFVYASFMPLYRKSVKKTFFSKCKT